MLESYLVVPTNGLAPDKATALAQFIRYVLGGRGQADIASLGAAGATPAMVLAGLKVAQQIAAEGVTSQQSNQTTGTTTTTTATALPASNSIGAGTGSLGGSSGGTLPATGTDEIPLTIVGMLLVFVGGIARRVVFRRRFAR